MSVRRAPRQSYAQPVKCHHSNRGSSEPPRCARHAGAVHFVVARLQREMVCVTQHFSARRTRVCRANRRRRGGTDYIQHAGHTGVARFRSCRL